jgi:putative ABC transport system permease protein
VVSADYFRALSIDVRRGRGIERGDDRPGAAPVAVVNETLARRFWPGQDPVGRAVSFAGRGGRVVARVVGVARDTRTRSLREAPRPHLYLAYDAGAPPAAMTLHVRTRGAPLDAAPAVLDAVRALAPELPVFAATTGRALVERTIRDTRLMASLAGLFGALALGIALVGLYGVTAYAVAERTREIGIRIALGAGAPRVLRLVLGEGLLVAAAGAAAGTAASLAALRLVRARLYGVSPADPATLAAAAGVLVLAALAASAGPARRALRTDPVRALQGD